MKYAILAGFLYLSAAVLTAADKSDAGLILFFMATGWTLPVSFKE